MSEPLVPADPKRCQAEITSYNPFVMGGPTRKTVRCDAVPVYIMTEAKPGPDGQTGSMSVCSACYIEFRKKHPRKMVKLEAI